MFTQTRRIASIATAILLLGLIATTAPVRAELIRGSGYVSGSRNTDAYWFGNKWNGPFSWDYGYTMNFDGTTVTAGVQIGFQFDSDVGVNQQDWKATIESAIESQWNSGYTFVLDGVAIAPLVDVTYGEPYDQTVRVKNPGDPINMLNWNWDQTPSTSAHEFGHMLGLYDEYWGGALNPASLVDDEALMGTASGTPFMRDRYYQPFVDFVVSLQQIPEPATMTMTISGILTGLALGWRKRKQRLQQAG